MSEVFRERVEEHGPLGWWYQQTAPREQPGASFAQRELVRRGRLASTILLGFLITGLIQLPFVYKGPQTLLMLLPAFLGMGLQIWLNRIGQVNVVGVLMVLISYSVLASLLTGGKLLDVPSLPVLDMLVVPEVMAVSLLPSISIFPVAVANSIIILTLARFLPHTAELGALLSTPDGRAVLTRSIALQFIVAIVAYLWVRSAVVAIKRADQAEVIAALERREAERTREIEDGVRQLLDILVRLANGDFASRVPLLANALLWRVGIAINTLIGRLERSSQAATQLQHFEEDANRLAQAIYALRPGDREVWITPQGTPLDRVLDAIRDTLPRLSGPQPLAPGPSIGAGTFGPALPRATQPPTLPRPSQPPHAPETAWPSLDDSQHSQPAQELPEWLRPPDSPAQ